MSQASDCRLDQNFILNELGQRPEDAEKTSNPRSFDTHDKPLDSQQTSTRYIPVPALLLTAPRPPERLPVTAEKRGQLC